MLDHSIDIYFDIVCRQLYIDREHWGVLGVNWLAISFRHPLYLRLTD